MHLGQKGESKNVFKTPEVNIFKKPLKLKCANSKLAQVNIKSNCTSPSNEESN